MKPARLEKITGLTDESEISSPKEVNIDFEQKEHEFFEKYTLLEKLG